ncbi:hypothetical protein ACFLSP_00950 [Bacteroidota bacterium]
MRIFKTILPLLFLAMVLNLGGLLSCQNLNEEDLFGAQCMTSW